MDFIGNFLTTLRNASKAGKLTCVYQWSKVNEKIVDILQKEGFIQKYSIEKNESGLRFLKVYLKYVKSEPVLLHIQRHSKPGCRLYYNYKEIPYTLGGLGLSILTTSRGVMHDRDARSQRCGGELICTVW